MKVSDRQSDVQKSRKRKLSQSKGGADEVKRTQNRPASSCFGRRNTKKTEHTVPLKKNSMTMIKAAPLGLSTSNPPIGSVDPVPDENVATSKTMRLKQSPLYHQYASCERALRTNDDPCIGCHVQIGPDTWENIPTDFQHLTKAVDDNNEVRWS